MYTDISACRICKSGSLTEVFSLGKQSLTGVFPKEPTAAVTSGPVDLVWCSSCGLLQLKQSYDLGEMYGDNYGYRSGLNASMVKHLTNKVRGLERFVELSNNDLVVDIGSNDATLLKAYAGKCRKVGIDPTASKFREFYTDDIEVITDFFSARVFRERFPRERARLITSIAMFYDLPDPVTFVRDIRDVLSDDGIWHFEQSYLPAMLRTNSYDTLCHEHLEFYSLRVVKDLLEKCDLRIVDVQTNQINGGSFAVTACKRDAHYPSNLPVINWMLDEEVEMGLHTIEPYLAFARRAERHRQRIVKLLNALVADGKTVLGYGASTKGNVLLQYAGIDRRFLRSVAEVNKEKFGAYTPGTGIPIISEEEARTLKPDYYFVLPWHFRNAILEREKSYLENGGRFIFPLPEIEIL